MVCPSDETLRSLLSNAEQETSTTDVLSHVADCQDCRDRVSAWNEWPRFDSMLRAAGKSDIALPPASRVLAPNGPEALTFVYGSRSLRQVGQYEILRPIGSGGGGDVFEARHTLLQKRVAIKLLKPKHSGDQVARQRFFREMESIGQLDDPNIVHAYDAGEVDGTLYLAMELVDGENVESLARRLGPMPIADACEIIRQAALGLQHVHECRLVHRDLKPSNLLMSKTGIKIADLGLALLNRREVTDEPLTGEHTVLGTADYMAPEQAEVSHTVDIRADIYSLGCTLFRLLTGRPPYAGPENTTPIKKIWAHASAPIPDVRELRSEVSPGLAELVQKLMAKAPEDRFAKPRELADALQPYCLQPDLPSLVVNIHTFRPGIERSSTAKDQTNRVDSNTKTKSLTESGTAPAGRLRQFLIAIGLMAGALIVLVSWFVSGPGPNPTANADPARIAAVTPPATPLPANIDPTPPPVNKEPPPRIRVPLRAIDNEGVPAAVVEPMPGTVAERWQKEFQILPAELRWPGRFGIGKWSMDEELRALVVQTTDSVRLIKLGDLKDGDDLDVAVTILLKSSDAACGFFVGYETEQEDDPNWSSFHAILIQMLPPNGDEKSLLVRRMHAKLDGITGDLGSLLNDSMTFETHSNQFRLQARLTSDDILSIRLNEVACEPLCSATRNQKFAAIPYRGPFGLIVPRGTVWISNPRVTRR